MKWEVRTMVSTTLGFSSTLYRKSLTRFWPLWALYTLLLLLLLPLALLKRYFQALQWGDTLSQAQEWLTELAYNIPGHLSFGVWLACIFGVLSAMAVFSYLYSIRSSCMMHALPLRREGLFLSQYLAGLSFSLLPHLAVALVTLLVELTLIPAEQWGRVLSSLGLWLLVQSALSLFFFSFAAFCAMFTGHLLALPAFYAILSVLVYVIYALLVELMQLFFYGYAGSSQIPAPVAWCTPIFMLADAADWDIVTTTVEDVTMSTGEWRLTSPSTVAVYAGVGVVLAVLALLVYRRRHVESAGDVVAIPLVRPIFKYGVSLCSGLCLGMFTCYFFSWSSSASLMVWVLIWSAIGYFVAEMLLRKSFRVLQAWKGCVAVVALLALLCLSCFCDFFGVEHRVPAPEQVASLRVDGSLSAPSDDGDLHLTLSGNSEQLKEIIAFHQAIVDEQDRADENSGDYQRADSYLSLSLEYRLSDGSTLSRQYFSVPIFQSELEQEGSVTWCARQLVQDRDLVEQCYDFDGHEAGRLVEAYLNGIFTRRGDGGQYTDVYLDGAAAEDLMGLWQAVRRDFDEGTIGVRYLFDGQERLENTYRADLCFVWELPDPGSAAALINPAGERYPVSASNGSNYSYLTITLTPNARHTLAWLEEMNALEDGQRLISYGDYLNDSEEEYYS